jgi:hypothetical protein
MISETSVTEPVGVIGMGVVEEMKIGVSEIVDKISTFVDVSDEMVAEDVDVVDTIDV